MRNILIHFFDKIIAYRTFKQWTLHLIIYLGYHTCQKSVIIENAIIDSNTDNNKMNLDEKSTKKQERIDDFIVWQPIFIHFLKLFINDDDVTLKILAKHVSTIFQDSNAKSTNWDLVFKEIAFDY